MCKIIDKIGDRKELTKNFNGRRKTQGKINQHISEDDNNKRLNNYLN